METTRRLRLSMVAALEHEEDEKERSLNIKRKLIQKGRGELDVLGNMIKQVVEFFEDELVEVSKE